MKLDEAIEILEIASKSHPHRTFPAFYAAAQLGVEALKAVQNARANNYYTPIATMPGETTD